MRVKIAIRIIILFSILSVFTSCGKPVYKNTFIISGTYLEIISADKLAAGIVYQEFKRLDKLFNLYDQDSEISRLNNTYNVPVKVSNEMIEVLDLSRQLTDLTGGAFDVSYGVLYDFWKKIIKQGTQQFPQQQKINQLREKCGMEHLETDKINKTVLVNKPGPKIDLSAIAKGYMVDKAIFRLKEKGIKSALVNAGGDIYCLGTNSGKTWNVGVRNPQKLSGIIESQKLVDESVSTSGNYEQFFDYQGKRYSHLVNPLTGYPVDNSILSVSVISKNCTTTDSLATAFSVMGLAGIKKFMASNITTMRIFAVIADDQGERVYAFE